MSILSQIQAHEAAHAEDLKRLRSLSIDERAAIFDSNCEMAKAIMDSRKAAGMPPVRPVPWPQSTWEFLRRHAPNARRDAEPQSE